jgi:hypothetical protein
VAPWPPPSSGHSCPYGLQGNDASLARPPKAGTFGVANLPQTFERAMSETGRVWLSCFTIG